MTSVFQVLAADTSEDQTQRRVATRIAYKRVQESFGDFIKAGEDDAKRSERFDLVADDLSNLVEATCKEYGFAAEDDRLRYNILQGIRSSLVNSSKQAPEPRIASVHEARRPKLCPYHKEVTDISLTQGEPRAGYDAMAQHAWSAHHCQGSEYEGNKCNFKPEMVTQTYWDEKEEKAQERREQREQERAQQLEQDEAISEVSEESEVDETVDNSDERDTEGTEDSLPDNVIEVDFGNEDAEADAGAEAEVPMGMAASVDDGVPLDKTAEKEHLKGVDSDKRQRQYKHIKEQCLEDGKSEEECKELAARTVNKQRSEKGETKSKVGYDIPTDAAVPKPNEPEHGAQRPGTGQNTGVGGQAPAVWDTTQKRYVLPDQLAPGYNTQRAPAMNQKRPDGGFNAIPKTFYTPNDTPEHLRAKRSEALETVDVEGNEGPVPEIDKHQWTPDNLEQQVDTESDGSPHPTREKDVTEPADFSDDDRFAETEAVLEKQDVTKDTEFSNNDGNTKSFPKGNQVNPVSSAVDVEKNPIREVLLEDDEGFLSEAEVTAAISATR